MKLIANLSLDQHMLQRSTKKLWSRRELARWLAVQYLGATCGAALTKVMEQISCRIGQVREGSNLTMAVCLSPKSWTNGSTTTGSDWISPCPEDLLTTRILSLSKIASGTNVWTWIGFYRWKMLAKRFRPGGLNITTSDGMATTKFYPEWVTLKTWCNNARFSTCD